MNRTLTLILFSLWSVTAYAQPSTPPADSLLQVFKNSTTSTKWRAAISLAELYMKKDLDSAFLFIAEAFEESKDQLSDEAILVKQAYANVQIERLQLEGIESLLMDIISHYEKTKKDSSQLATSLNHLGRYYNYLQPRNHEAALTAFRSSLEIQKRLDDPVGYGKSLSNFAIMLYNLERPEAIEAFHKALNILDAANEQRDVLRIYFNLVYAFSPENKPYYNLDSAIFYGKKGIKLAKALEFPMGLAKLKGVIASPLIRKGYEEPSFLEEGLAAAVESKEFFEGTPFKIDYYYGWLNEGYAEEGLGNYKKAIRIAQDLLKTDFPDQSECHRLLYRAYKGTGDFRQSLYYHELYKDFQDSVTERNMTQELAELQTRYESEIKDQQIESLTQRTAIQKLQLNQRQILLYGSVALFLVLLTAVVFWSQRRAAMKVQALADMEQKLLRLQMNPHFIFNTLGTIQHLLLDNSADLAGRYLSKFAKLVRQTLEFSREDFISLEDELILLENYIQLQKLSTGQDFKHQIILDPEMESTEIKVPPMFAQPFIENAIVHAKLGEFQDGKLEVRFSEKSNFLNVAVQDNGVGISSDETSDHQSMAIQITKERLRILETKFKVSLKFSLEDLFPQKERRGTYMNLQLPLL